MKKSKFTGGQMPSILKQYEAGVPVTELDSDLKDGSTSPRIEGLTDEELNWFTWSSYLIWLV